MHQEVRLIIYLFGLNLTQHPHVILATEYCKLAFGLCFEGRFSSITIDVLLIESSEPENLAFFEHVGFNEPLKSG